MLVHICCSVDSYYFLDRLQTELPNEKIVAFFYNPNIHPKEEYDLRLQDVQMSCKKLNIPLYEGNYDEGSWIRTRITEAHHSEGGARCEGCFDERLEQTAIKARKLGEQIFTTTLMTSPKKSLDKLYREGIDVAKQYELNFFFIDYRKDGGTQKQFALAKTENLYKQNYCGCIFALDAQRKQQQKEPIETYLPLNKQVLPNSFAEKSRLHKTATLNSKAKVIKEDFLNYRLKRSHIKAVDTVVDSHILFYSILSAKNNTVKSKLFSPDGKFYYFEKNGAILIDTQTFSHFLDKIYQSVKDIRQNPPSIEEEIALRHKLTGTYFSLTPIVVLDKIYLEKPYSLYIDSKIWPDVRENLMKIR